MSYFRSLACDLDGTLAMHDQLHPDVLAALDALRQDGIATLLVTGRIREELDRDFPGLDEHFDAVVTENGAVAATPVGTRLLASPIEVALERALEDRGVPFRRGRVLLACDGIHTATVAEEVQRLGLDCQLVHNRDALMVLPSGISKGRGLFVTLGAIGLSFHNTVAVGDAENDLSLLLTAEVGAAVSNAVPSVREHADLVLDQPAGAGVAALVRGPLFTGQQRLCPPRRWIRAGTFDDGTPALVPGSQGSVLITGESGSGKSHLAGMLVEQWVDAGYSVLVVDPEGDHSGLASMPGVLRVDAAARLPTPSELVAMLRLRFCSVILDLSAASARDKAAYIRALPSAVEGERLTHGLPHWLMIDEAHLPAEGIFDTQPLPQLSGRGLCLVTYQPHLLPEQLRDGMDATITVTEGPMSSGSSRANPRGMLSESTGERPFTASERRTRHVRHLHKYSAGELPEHHRFYFHGSDLPPAANLVEFARRLRWLSPQALEFHIARRDFSRWFAGTIQDLPLAELAAHHEQDSVVRVALDLERARSGLMQAISSRYDDGDGALQSAADAVVSLPADVGSAGSAATTEIQSRSSR